MQFRSRLLPWLAAAATLAGAGPGFANEVVRLSGAASVVDSLIAPHQAEVEKASGLKLTVNKSNAGKGLIDLADGKCEAALASASIETVVGAAKAAGREIDPSRLKMTVIKSDEIVFVVHPDNPVRALTRQQVSDLHTGRIANWKEVGGPDLAVQVVTDAASSATRGLIKAEVLKGADYVASARAVPIEQVAPEVAQARGAIGGLGQGFVQPGVVVIRSDKLERPLGLITLGAPSPQVERVIAAYRNAVR